MPAWKPFPTTRSWPLPNWLPNVAVTVLMPVPSGNAGLLPIDTLDLHEKERGLPIEVDRQTRLDWQRCAGFHRSANGMRNSNVMAIAPTATISTIIGVSQSIEPSYKHLYVKSNLSGEFTQVNRLLVDDLKARGLVGLGHAGSPQVL